VEYGAVHVTTVKYVEPGNCGIWTSACNYCKVCRAK
jgi:hypothetical protein